MEFGKIQGVPEEQRREFGVNLTAGRVNCIEMSQKALRAPTMDTLLKAYQEKKTKKPQPVLSAGHALEKVV